MLPPVSSRHVTRYIAIFSNGGTAAIYVSFLRMACLVSKTGLHWHGPEIVKAVKGVKKIDLRWFGEPTTVAFLFNKKLIQMLHVYQKHRGRPAQSWFSLFSWELCLRNKSECFKIYKGCIDDLLRLPEGRINSAFCDKFGRLHFVMKKRKRRPRGSKLMITCRCAEVKHSLVCTFRPFLDEFQVGQVV